MDSIHCRTSQRLQLDGIQLNARLAKRIPPSLAFNYHVLPLAEENNRITVAMADPENKFAVEAVKSVLGATPYIVKSDPLGIDKLLIELWPGYQNHTVQVLVCIKGPYCSETFIAYSNYIRNLFNVPNSGIFTVYGVENDVLNAIREMDGKIDLVILDERFTSSTVWAISRLKGVRTKDPQQPSIWVTRRPSWPIEKILMVLDFGNRDHVGVDWIMKMALQDRPTVTMLVPLPTVPKMYQGFPEMSILIPKILKGDSELGKHFRSLVSRLEECGVEVRLKISEGPARSVIHEEVSEGDYELITVSDEQRCWLMQSFISSIVRPVLEFGRSSIFITKPING